MFGMAANNWVKKECCADLKAWYPDVPWVDRTHYVAKYAVGDGPVQSPAGLISSVNGVVAVWWDPDEDKGHYHWREKTPARVMSLPRSANLTGAVFGRNFSTYRIFAEGVCLSAGSQFGGLAGSIGAGHLGADFWPVVPDPKGGAPKTLINRYVSWYDLGIGDVVSSLLAPGAQGPEPTCLLRMMQEAEQEAEARIFVQNALLDHADQLGPDLAKRCQEVCDERTREFHYYSKFCEVGLREDYARGFSRSRWDELSEKLYKAADEVAKALHGK